MLIYIIITITIIIVIYFGVTYNCLVKLNNIAPERILKELIELRNSAYDKMSTNEKVDLNNKLSQGISKLMAVVEAYPNLKANENFKYLSQQLTKVEDDIANSRKYYNGTVRLMNNKVQMFPSNIVAVILGFKEQKMFELNEFERINIKVEL